MPLSMQQKIENEIERLIEVAGLEVTKTSVYGNVIDLHVTEKGSFSDLFHVHLMFDMEKVRGGLMLEGDRLVNNGPNRSIGDGKVEMIRERYLSATYSKPAEMEAFFSRISAFIVERAPAQGPVNEAFEAILVRTIDEGGEPSMATDVLAAVVREIVEANPSMSQQITASIEKHLDHAYDMLPEHYSGAMQP